MARPSTGRPASTSARLAAPAVAARSSSLRAGRARRSSSTALSTSASEQPVRVLSGDGRGHPLRGAPRRDGPRCRIARGVADRATPAPGRPSRPRRPTPRPGPPASSGPAAAQVGRERAETSVSATEPVGVRRPPVGAASRPAPRDPRARRPDSATSGVLTAAAADGRERPLRRPATGKPTPDAAAAIAAGRAPADASAGAGVRARPEQRGQRHDDARAVTGIARSVRAVRRAGRPAGHGAAVGPPARLDDDQVAGPADDAELVDPTAGRRAAQVDDDRERRGRLAVHRGAVQPGAPRRAPRAGPAPRPGGWRAGCRSRRRARC